MLIKRQGSAPIDIILKSKLFSWVRRKHRAIGDYVPMPPLQDGDPYRSMSVVPYLEDLHSPESGSTSLIDEDETVGTETLRVPGMKDNDDLLLQNRHP